MSDNPIPASDIPYQELARLCVGHGWDQAVLIYRREGRDGGEGITCMGRTYRDSRVADEMMRFLRTRLLGWEMEGDVSKSLDEEVRQARIEMGEGSIADPNAGKKLIMPAIENTRRDKIVDRGPKGTVQKQLDKMGGTQVKRT